MLLTLLISYMHQASRIVCTLFPFCINIHTVSQLEYQLAHQDDKGRLLVLFFTHTLYIDSFCHKRASKPVQLMMVSRKLHILKCKRHRSDAIFFEDGTSSAPDKIGNTGPADQNFRQANPQGA